THSLYWIRNYYDTIIPEKINNKIIVHGHTSRPFNTLEQELSEMKYPAVNIDCGCVYVGRPGYGHLCALDLDTMRPIFQKNVDRIEKPVASEESTL
ncbi:MAG TPA: hypothetical protein PKE14_12075, partial [Chitinophagales bacterium]|nr:hypothetical protein [Chitinophagales bacterium]